MSDRILEIENMNLVFNLRLYGERSLRDSFVGFFSRPIQSLLAPRDSLHVLKEVNLSLSRSERLAVIGVNGSGKTSLCRCIAGILSPTSGRISVNGRVRALFSTSAGIHPQLTGRENARLLARLYYPDETERSRADLVEEALRFSELGGFLDVPYEVYSQGMKSRLTLSLATAKSCDLLILDEIYDNADVFFREKMAARMRKFIHGAGAVIFISHSAEYLRENCNRAIVLQDGRVRYDGGVETALAAYRFLNGAAPAGVGVHDERNRIEV